MERSEEGRAEIKKTNSSRPVFLPHPYTRSYLFAVGIFRGIDMKEKKNKVDGVRTNRGNWGVMRAESVDGGGHEMESTLDLPVARSSRSIFCQEQVSRRKGGTTMEAAYKRREVHGT